MKLLWDLGQEAMWALLTFFLGELGFFSAALGAAECGGRGRELQEFVPRLGVRSARTADETRGRLRGDWAAFVLRRVHYQLQCPPGCQDMSSDGPRPGKHVAGAIHG